MRDYLESMLDVFTDAQKERLMKNIGSLYKGTERKLDVSEYKMLLDYLKSNHKSELDKIKFKDKIDSLKYNRFMEELDRDLKFLYNESDAIETIINNYEVLTDSIVSEIEYQLRLLENEVNKLRYETVTGKEKGLQQVHITATNANEYIIDLSNDANKKIMDFLLEDPRTNKKISNIVKIDASNKNISLPINTAIDAINNDTKIRLVGSTVDFNKATSSDIKNTIDKNTSTFYGDIFLFRGELKKPYGIKLDEKDIDYYKTFNDGVIYDIELTLDRKYNINEIVAQMYEKYSTELLCVLYKTTTDVAEDFKEYKLNETILSEHSEIDMKCSPFSAIILRLIFRQKTYEKHSYVMLIEDLKNSSMIEKIFNAEKEATSKNIYSNLSQEEIDSLTSMAAYQDKLREFKTKFEEFKKLLKQNGFNWTDQQIIAYIKTGKY